MGEAGLRLLVNLGIALLVVVIHLGNFWFTYGIWPRSWVSFAVFASLSLIMIVLSTMANWKKTAGSTG